MKKESVTVRMPPAMVVKLKTEAEALGVNFSQLVIEILEAQLNGKKFSNIDFLVRKTFRRVSE